MEKKPTQKRGMRILNRVASMTGAEMVDRTRQELHKHAGDLLSRCSIDPVRNEITEGTHKRSHFFFAGEDIPARVNLLKGRMPEQVETIVRTAQKICQHRFDLLGFKDLDYGREIDWHQDVVHGKRAPLESWFKVPYLEFGVVGDSKITWELNRHQHFVTLAKAYRLTGDSFFASELVNQWQDWQEKNPYPKGINWASSLEVAFRSISWIWAYKLLEGTEVDSQFRKQWLHAIALNGRHIELYLSTYFSPNTHLLGEAMALFFIGTVCPELKSSAKWSKQGWDILLRESKRQVRPDGFYFEQSTYYHVYALDFFLHSAVLASLNEVTAPREFLQTIESMLGALALLCRAGVPPRWGDDDGGRLFDAQRNRAADLADPLSTGAVLFGRGDLKFLAGDIREETIWLFGKGGIDAFEQLRATPPAMRSASLVESGLFFMSSDVNQLQAVIDAGPHGALTGGHGHADGLSMTIHADGSELIGDPGTFEYTSATGAQRSRFRGTDAHNTLTIDGKNQADANGPFAWQRLVSCKPKEWITGEHFDLFVGSHEGYSEPGSPLVHQRSVFFRKSKFWLVRDLVLGSGHHRLNLNWHVNPELALVDDAAERLLFSGKKAGLSVYSAKLEGCTSEVVQGLWSAAYGASEPSPEIRITTQATLPAEFVTLLMPTPLSAGVHDVHSQLLQVPCEPGTRAYRYVEEQDDHVFVFAEETNWKFAEWTSDASFMYYNRTEGSLSLLVLCNCTHAEFRGETIVSTSKRIAKIEISNSNGVVEVNCSEKALHISPEAIDLTWQGSDEVARVSDGGTS
jgi:Heparinase II/III-like protein/Heparinase II/III N-terminus